MSASDKKKLRKEEAAVKMTEKQVAEQKESKKLKTWTIVFSALIAAMLVFAVFTAVTQTITNSGIIERNTVAVTVNDQEVSTAELNIYYMEAINDFAQNYGSYAALFGLDVTKPLDEQIVDEETGLTWADDFLNSAKDSLRAVYAMSDLAEKAGMTLTEEQITQIDTTVDTLELYGMMYGFNDAEGYLKAMYGNGCTIELFRSYLERTTLADAYYASYGETLTYEDADLRAHEIAEYHKYSAFTYTFYNLPVNKFLTGGTTAEDGTTTYSDEEKAAAVAAAEEAAKTLTAENILTVEDLDAAIAALEINAEVEGAASTTYTDYAYNNVTAVVREWLSSYDRIAGDITYLANTTTSTDEAGNETTTVNSYTVVMYHGTNDNIFPLANVRHILISYTGGTTDANGVTTYSEDEKMAAEATGADLLAQWETAGATEEAFANLAKEHSTDPGSKENGGLYEDVYPGQTVPAFNDWCFDEARQPGDTGLVHTDYGCHVMYYVGDSDITYRDFMITNELKNADVSEWYTAQLEKYVVTDVNLKHIDTDITLG